MSSSENNDLYLSPRERVILELVAKGMTTPSIASQLSLSPETIKWYRKQMLAKFSAATSAEMVRMAVERGMLDKTFTL